MRPIVDHLCIVLIHHVCITNYATENWPPCNWKFVALVIDSPSGQIVTTLETTKLRDSGWYFSGRFKTWQISKQYKGLAHNRLGSILRVIFAVRIILIITYLVYPGTKWPPFRRWQFQEWKQSAFWLELHWWFSIGSGSGLTPKRRLLNTVTNADPVHIYALGGDELMAKCLTNALCYPHTWPSAPSRPVSWHERLTANIWQLAFDFSTYKTVSLPCLHSKRNLRNIKLYFRHGAATLGLKSSQ